MKRKILIKELKRVRNELVTKGLYGMGMNKDSDYDKAFLDVINALEGKENPLEYIETDITLAEFLGWEERTEYKASEDKFLLKDDYLLYWNFAYDDWLPADGVSLNRLQELRDAKKIESKKYYAKIKGAELIDKENVYWNWDNNQRSLFVGGKCSVSEFLTKFTKEKWASIGINDTNADFEEVK